MKWKTIFLLASLIISLLTLSTQFMISNKVIAQEGRDGISKRCVPHSPNCGCYVGYTNCQTNWAIDQNSSADCDGNKHRYISKVYGLHLYDYGKQVNWSDHPFDFLTSCIAQAHVGLSYTTCGNTCW